MWANKQPASEGGAETRTQMHVRVSPASTSRCRGLALHPLMLVSVPRARESRRRRAICGPIRIVRASAVFIPTPIHMVAKWQHQPVRTSTALHHYYSPPGQCTLKSLPLPSIPLLIHEHHGQQYTSRTPERFPAREISAPPPRGTDYFMGRDAWGAAPTEPMQAVWARPVAPTAEEKHDAPASGDRWNSTSASAGAPAQDKLQSGAVIEWEPALLHGVRAAAAHARGDIVVTELRVTVRPGAAAAPTGQPGLASLDCEGGASSERRAARPDLRRSGRTSAPMAGAGGCSRRRGTHPASRSGRKRTLTSGSRRGTSWWPRTRAGAGVAPRGDVGAQEQRPERAQCRRGALSPSAPSGSQLECGWDWGWAWLGDAAPPSAPAPPQGGELAEEDPGAAERGADRSRKRVLRGVRGAGARPVNCLAVEEVVKFDGKLGRGGAVGVRARRSEGLARARGHQEGREPAANAGWRLAFLLGFKLLLRLLLVVILVFVSTARPGIIVRHPFVRGRWGSGGFFSTERLRLLRTEEGELERRCGLGSSGSLALSKEVAAPARRTVEHCDCGGVGGETVLLLPHGRLRVVPCAAFVGAGAQEGLSLSVVRGGLALRRAARVVRPADGGQVDDAAQRGLGEHRVGRAARDAAGRLVPAGNIFAIEANNFGSARCERLEVSTNYLPSNKGWPDLTKSVRMTTAPSKLYTRKKMGLSGRHSSATPFISTSASIPRPTLPTGAEEDTEADEGRNTRAGENPSTQTRATKGPASGAKDGNVVPYLDEGEGCVYFTGVLQKKAIQELHPKELPRQMIVKWGYSSNTTPARSGRLKVWFCAFKVERRLLAERIIRLRLLDEGYALVKFEEPCPCNPPPPRIPLHASGGLPGGNRKACGRILEEMGEQNIACQILRPRRRCAKYAVGLLKFGRS
ncbi:hypothetical protein B0H14DRAFT_2561636 [Mycena olivaceomarginata]|nr:hypothetical protein B0H14DRAFT_2561636 [Mycena olivaceomarginata]